MKTLTLFATAVLAVVVTGCNSNDKMPSAQAAAVPQLGGCGSDVVSDESPYSW